MMPVVDEGLRLRIARLPSAEELSGMKELDLPEVKSRAERILFDVDRKKKRSVGNAQRYTVKTKLPPVRKPITAAGDWYDLAVRYGDTCRSSSDVENVKK
jgi:hypothetical protein